MDLVSYSPEDLSSFRPNDYFFDPGSRKIYQYRNKEGKAIIVREIGTTHITKLFKNTLKTILKVEGDFDKYQVIGISDTSITLFNANIGESFEVGFGDADNVEDMKTAFNKGDEIIADVFDYDDIKETMKLSIANAAPESAPTQSVLEPAEVQVSSSELQRIKEIEEKKAKKRPFNTSEPAKTTGKPQIKESKPNAKTSLKDEKKVEQPVKKEVKKVEPSTKQEEKKKVEPPVKKEEKKVEPPPKKEEKKETKEEKKEREKKEKEQQKELERKQKELEKKQKDEQKAKKGKK